MEVAVFCLFQLISDANFIHAKKSVEIFIEQDEKAALKYIDKQTR